LNRIVNRSVKRILREDLGSEWESGFPQFWELSIPNKNMNLRYKLTPQDMELISQHRFGLCNLWEIIWENVPINKRTGKPSKSLNWDVYYKYKDNPAKIFEWLARQGYDIWTECEEMDWEGVYEDDYFK